MQKIRLDFADPTYIPTIRAMQGDVYSRFVQLELYYDGVPYEIKEGSTFKVCYKLRGGLEGAYDTIPLPDDSPSRPACTFESNVVTMELGEILTIDGNVGKISLTILGTDSSRLSTWEMIYLCGAYPSASESSPSFDDVGELITKAAFDALRYKNDAEDAAERAENSAKSSEEDAKASKDSAEAAAESARKAAASEPASAAERAEAAAKQTEEDAALASKSSSDAALAALASSQSQASAKQSAIDAEESAKKAAYYSTSGNPAGTVIWYAGESAPEGYMICNGALIDRTTYSVLFAAIGTTYGEGDGTTTFALPNLHGYIVEGNRLTVGKTETFVVGQGDRITRILTLLPCIKY